LAYQVAGTNPRYRDSRRESAVAQLLPLGLMNTKAFISLTIVSLTLVCGKAQTNVVAGTAATQESSVAVYVERSTYQAYTGLQLKQIAIDFAKQNNIGFDFTNAGCCIWIYTDGSDVIAKVVFDYGSRMLIKRYYWADINRSGNVVKHEVGIRSFRPLQ
jgi:hypothetical protein